VKALLDSGATELVISLEFTKKQRFKLKKNRKAYLYAKYRWFFQQERIYRVYGKSKYPLLRA